MYAYIIDHFNGGEIERETASAKRFRTKREAVENLEGTGYKPKWPNRLPTYFHLKRDGRESEIIIVNLRDREWRNQYETVRETMASWA